MEALKISLQNDPKPPSASKRMEPVHSAQPETECPLGRKFALRSFVFGSQNIATIKILHIRKTEAAGFARRLAAILTLTSIPATAFSAAAEAWKDTEETPCAEVRGSGCKMPRNGTCEMLESRHPDGGESANLRKSRAEFLGAYSPDMACAGIRRAVPRESKFLHELKPRPPDSLPNLFPPHRPAAKASAAVPCPICSRESRSAVFIPGAPDRGQARFTSYPVAHAGRILAPEISIKSTEETFRELMTPPNPMTESGGIFDATGRSVEADGGEYIIMIRRDATAPIYLKSVKGS